MQQEGLAQKILIIDLDVHQGDGTAWIFKDDPSVFTFSMHCDINFPGTKQDSDLDVGLTEGMGDDDYLQTLDRYLPDLLHQTKPDLVLYDAGVDPHIGDKLGKLCLTDSGIYRRDMQVISACLSGGYPIATVIGGGYCEDFNALVYRHSLVHRAASVLNQLPKSAIDTEKLVSQTCIVRQNQPTGTFYIIGKTNLRIDVFLKKFFDS